MSPEYLQGRPPVRLPDRPRARHHLRDPESRDHTLVVVTADHGGIGPSHSDPRKFADYRIPFLVWGPGVPAGVDLYDLNPTYADPGSLRVGYGKAAAAGPQRRRRQPGPRRPRPAAIPHSELDYDQDLEVFAAR